MLKVSKLQLGALVIVLVGGPSALAQGQASPSSVEALLNLDSSQVGMGELFAQDYDYPSTGAEVGRGWNSFLSQPSSSKCVTGVDAPLSVNFNSVNYSDVFDREQLMSSMRVSAKASFGSVASARASYSRSVKLDRSQRNIVATVDVILDGKSLAPQDSGTGFKRIALLPEALKVLKQSGKTVDQRIVEFYQMCGDSYVSAIHNGGRLNAFFFLTLSEQEVKETFKASASGSYGGFSGSASAQSTVQRNKSSSNLKVDQIHWGGPAGVVGNADGMLGRIDSFSRLTAEQAKPFTVWTTSYRQVSNWPAEFQYTGLTARTVSLMAGQVWRLQELADLYADAATAPQRFYFPFTAGNTVPELQKASVIRSDALYAASSCMQNLAMFCALRTSCDIKEVFKPETLSGVCPALKDSDAAYRATVGATLLGTRPRNALSTLAPELNKVLESTNRQLLSKPSTTTLMAAPQPGTVPPSAPAAASQWFTPAEMYYRLLAEAPLPRSWTADTDNTRDALDATRQLEWFCTSEQLNCANVTYAKFSSNDDPNTDAKSVLKSWVVRTKLLPLAVGFCKEAGHPMCLSQTKLAALMDGLEPQFGSTRLFVSKPPPPPAANPAPRPKPPRYERVCVPGRGGCPPV